MTVFRRALAFGLLQALAACNPQGAATPAEPSLASALAGDGPAPGRFWVPRDDGATSVLADDVLLDPDGTFVNHIHEHPGLVGTWRVRADTLTFYDGEGVELLVIKAVRIGSRTLWGEVNGRPARLQEVDP